MVEKIAQLWPEIALFITTCIVMVVGLSPRKGVRDLCAPLCGLGLVVAGILAARTTPTSTTIPASTSLLPDMALYAKVLVCGVGLILLMLIVGVDSQADGSTDEVKVGGGGRAWDPLRSIRAEFYAFFLFSLTGLLLCAGADDLIYLFLALELTSLPTYIMVTLSTNRNRSMEAGVKYFFLGAMGAAVFLYGFALIYGATGSTNFIAIQRALADQAATQGVSDMALIGLVLALLGMGFKIAAVPMHFYTPDVYEGAAAPVAGFLAFVPKTAGFFSIMLLCATVGWSYGESGESLPEAIRLLLWVVAALTMTVGNVLALLQTSIKRILAYSSIAHSGYMLVGVIAGPGPEGAGIGRNGLGAVLFYLTCYAVMTLGGFAVVACLERRTHTGKVEEADSLADIRGLCQRLPILGWTMVISSMGLLGLPPLLGFFGKVPLFTAGIGAGEMPLVIVLGLNSAIAAWYYLGLAKAALLDKPDAHGAGAEPVMLCGYPSRMIAGAITAVLVVVLALGGGGSQLAAAAGGAGKVRVEGTEQAAGEKAAGSGEWSSGQ